MWTDVVSWWEELIAAWMGVEELLGLFSGSAESRGGLIISLMFRSVHSCCCLVIALVFFSFFLFFPFRSCIAWIVFGG